MERNLGIHPTRELEIPRQITDTLYMDIVADPTTRLILAANTLEQTSAQGVSGWIQKIQFQARKSKAVAAEEVLGEVFEGASVLDSQIHQILRVLANPDLNDISIDGRFQDQHPPMLVFEKNYPKALVQQPQEPTFPLTPADRLKIGNGSLEWALQAYQGIALKLATELQKAYARQDSEAIKLLTEGLMRIESRKKQTQMIKVFLNLNPERPILLSNVYSRDGKPDPIVAFVYRYKNRLPKVSPKPLKQAA